MPLSKILKQKTWAKSKSVDVKDRRWYISTMAIIALAGAIMSLIFQLAPYLLKIVNPDSALINTIILLDTSEQSLAPLLNSIDKARVIKSYAQEVMRGLSDADHIGLNTFGGGCDDSSLQIVKLAGNNITKITNSVDKLRFQGVRNLVRGLADATALFADSERFKGKTKRVVVITGGLDSCFTQAQALAELNRRQVETGVKVEFRLIGLGIPIAEQSHLSEIATLLGGEAVFPSRLEDLRSTASRSAGPRLRGKQAPPAFESAASTPVADQPAPVEARRASAPIATARQGELNASSVNSNDSPEATYISIAKDLPISSLNLRNAIINSGVTPIIVLPGEDREMEIFKLGTKRSLSFGIPRSRYTSGIPRCCEEIGPRAIVLALAITRKNGVTHEKLLALPPFQKKNAWDRDRRQPDIVLGSQRIGVFDIDTNFLSADERKIIRYPSYRRLDILADVYSGQIDVAIVLYRPDLPILISQYNLLVVEEAPFTWAYEFSAARGISEATRVELSQMAKLILQSLVQTTTEAVSIVER